MIAFANPWAWIGALTLALPIAVHLLRRHRAPKQLFPTLRFLPESRVVAVRRHRPTDVALMLIRLGVIAGAILALTQPVWRGAAASRVSSPGVSRAIVVDRSPRMSQLTEDGRPAAERATAELGALTAAANQTIVETSNIRAGLASAASWATRQPGDREIVIVSSFPAGSLSAADVAAVGAGIGLKVIAIPLKPNSQVIGPVLEARADRDAPRSLVPHATATADQTSVSWSADVAVTSSPIEWRAGAEDMAAINKATSAAFDIGIAARAADRPVLVVLPTASDRSTIVAKGAAIDAVWMSAAMRALATDRVLESAARVTTAAPAEAPAIFTPIVRDAAGVPLLAGARLEGTPSQLLLVSNAPPASLFTAALSTAIANATRATEWSALEPISIPREELTQWERPTKPVAAPPSMDGTPIGRWLWLLALMFLAVEWWWRRRPEPATASTTEARRVA